MLGGWFSFIVGSGPFAAGTTFSGLCCRALTLAALPLLADRLPCDRFSLSCSILLRDAADGLALIRTPHRGHRIKAAWKSASHASSPQRRSKVWREDRPATEAEETGAHTCKHTHAHIYFE